MRRNALAFVVVAAVLLGGMTALGAAAPPAPASLYFGVPASAVPAGGTFSITVMVDATQPLNAYAFAVAYGGTANIRFIGPNDAHSIVNVWQNLPIGTSDGSGGGTVTFSGGSLAPFKGSGGELMTLNFAAVAPGTAVFSFGLSHVYLANGKGTPIVPQAAQAEVKIGPPEAGGVTGIVGAPTSTAPGNTTDSLPPAIRYLEFVQGPASADQELLAFQVADTASGIRETDLRYWLGFSWSDWRTAENPVLLPAGVWAVDFRAIDNAGNVAEETAYNWSAIRGPAAAAAGLAIVLLAAGAGWWWLSRRRMRGNGSSKSRIW